MGPEICHGTTEEGLREDEIPDSNSYQDGDEGVELAT
jgi:hypothetical protein